MRVVGKNAIRYEDDFGRLHNEDGPALISYKGSEYNEWWRNGILLAVQKEGVLYRSKNNSFSNLEELVVPKKLEDFINTLTVSEIQNFEPKKKNDMISDFTVNEFKTEEFKSDVTSRISQIRKSAFNVDSENKFKFK